jgi:hypothetical protein
MFVEVKDVECFGYGSDRWHLCQPSCLWFNCGQATRQYPIHCFSIVNILVGHHITLPLLSTFIPGCHKVKFPRFELESIKSEEGGVNQESKIATFDN